MKFTNRLKPKNRYAEALPGRKRGPGESIFLCRDFVLKTFLSLLVVSGLHLTAAAQTEPAWRFDAGG